MKENIKVNKRLALKLLEQGHFNELDKVENEIYYFKYSDKLNKIVEDYTVNMSVVSEALEDCIDTTVKDVCEPVTEVQDIKQATTLKEDAKPVNSNISKEKPVKLFEVYSPRIKDALVNDYKLQVAKTGVVKKTSYFFANTEEFKKAFRQIRNGSLNPNANKGDLSHEDKKLMSKLLSSEKYKLVSMQLEDEEIVKHIECVMGKLK